MTAIYSLQSGLCLIFLSGTEHFSSPCYGERPPRDWQGPATGLATEVTHFNTEVTHQYTKVTHHHIEVTHHHTEVTHSNTGVTNRYNEVSHQ